MLPSELLDPEALRGLPDGELIERYERLRDAEVAGPGGCSVHPNVGVLMGTPFEREKDRREAAMLADAPELPEMQAWYAEAAKQPCSWWLDHHLAARHAFHSCMACGVCASQCPAARFHASYSPRRVVDAALSHDEKQLEALLSSDELWLCGQCGSCKARCPRGNSIIGLVSSLRQLAELKGFHLRSVRGRQQYAGRHLWGGNLWNRGMSMHFRNVIPSAHKDFGPRWEAWFADAETQMRRVGATPDEAGNFGGRYTCPEALAELRACIHGGGTLAIWQKLEHFATEDAQKEGLTIDDYHDRVGSEG